MPSGQTSSTGPSSFFFFFGGIAGARINDAGSVSFSLMANIANISSAAKPQCHMWFGQAMRAFHLRNEPVTI